MFVLRTKYSSSPGESQESNRTLGEDYTLIRKEENIEGFSRIFNSLKDRIDPTLDEDAIYGFLCGSNMDRSEPNMGYAILFFCNDYYVMTESGNTFDNITHR